MEHAEKGMVVVWLERAVGAILPKGRFARSISVLAGGTALGQAIGALASPMLTRLYSPDDFGVMGVYVSLLSIFSVMASLRYQLAIPLPEKDEEAVNLLALSLVIVLLTSLLVGLGAWLLTDQIIAWVNAPALRSYLLWALPLGVGMVGTYGVFSYWAMRKHAFGGIARTKVNQGLGLVLTQVGLGVLEVGPVGLLLGQIVGKGAGTSTLAARAWREDVKLLKAISSDELSRVAMRYRRFPLFSSWSAVFNTLSSQIPTLMLSYFFGSEITGLYTFSHRVVGLPMQLVGQATAQVFFPEAVEANREGSLAATTDMVFRRLVLLGAPAVLLMALAAPELFAVVFGEEWREGGTYAQWLAPWLFLVFISSPLSILPSVVEKQRQEAVFQAFLLSGRAGALVFGGFLNHPQLAVALFAGVSALFWFGFMVWNMGLSGHGISHILGILLSEVVAATWLALPLILVKILADGDLYVLGAGGLSGALTVYRVVRKLKSEGRLKE